MAKEPGSRPPTGPRSSPRSGRPPPAPTGGWEERGRSHLGEAALLLAALWPLGAPPAVQGFATRAAGACLAGPRGRGEEQGPAAGGPRAARSRHLWHVLHLDHLAHLLAPAAPPRDQRGRRGRDRGRAGGGRRGPGLRAGARLRPGDAPQPTPTPSPSVSLPPSTFPPTPSPSASPSPSLSSSPPPSAFLAPAPTPAAPIGRVAVAVQDLGVPYVPRHPPLPRRPRHPARRRRPVPRRPADLAYHLTAPDLDQSLTVDEHVGPLLGAGPRFTFFNGAAGHSSSTSVLVATSTFTDASFSCGR